MDIFANFWLRPVFIDMPKISIVFIAKLGIEYLQPVLEKDPDKVWIFK